MLEEKIMQDYVSAMKAKDSIRASALSFLRASLKNYAIDKRKDKLLDDEVISVVKKQVKQRQDSIEQFKQGNRLDLVEKEVKELEILEVYLPQGVSEDKLRLIIEEVVASLGLVSMEAMGKVMKEVMAKAGSGADGKTVSALVKERLQKK